MLLSPNKEAMPPFSPYERQPLAGNITRIQHLDDDAMDAPQGDICKFTRLHGNSAQNHPLRITVKLYGMVL